METFTCFECGGSMTADDTVCPHCGATSENRVPSYPKMGGGAFLVIWIFFVLLVVGLVVTWFSNLN